MIIRLFRGARAHALLFGLLALAALAGCAVEPDDNEVTVRSVAPAWKSPRMQLSERRNCEYIARGLAEPYADCLRRLGYRAEILYPNAVPAPATPTWPTYRPPPVAAAPPVYRLPPPPTYSPPPEPPRRYEPPPEPQSPVAASPEPLSSARSSDSGQTACVVASFLDLVKQYQAEIFRVAHPTGTIDRSFSKINRNVGGQAVIFHYTYWRGAITGKNYQTVLRFTFNYRTSSKIDDVDVDALEDNNPIPRAFVGAETAKQAGMLYLGDKLKEARLLPASIIARIINSSLSVKEALSEVLKYAASNSCGGG